ncbi:MAG: hypothetical protein HDQ97_17595 [Lachnospiraceae bacterium]|nr:hypothetical protein [Lachnospiraceae bacterium]
MLLMAMNGLDAHMSCCAILVGATGKNWLEGEIIICGQMDWRFMQLLQFRLKEYVFVFIYYMLLFTECIKSRLLGKLYSVTVRGCCVFISAVYNEIVSMDMLGYNHTGVTG